MPPSLTPQELQNPVLIGQIFAYQQTKRLDMLLDQLVWSVNASLSHKTMHPVQNQLQHMLEEAKHHVLALANDLKNTGK